MTQGQGDGTEFKVRGFQAALKMSVDLARSKPGFVYHHLDLNAGSGYNHEFGVIGSPIAALRAFAAGGRTNFRAQFFDINEGAAEQLCKTLGTERRAIVVNADNAEAFIRFRGQILEADRNPQFAHGSIIVDPNGYTGDWPFEDLRQFAVEFPRIDLILNLNTRVYQMGKANKAMQRPGWVVKFWPRLAELPGMFAREHWLVRQPVASNGHRFVMLVGRSCATGDHKALGFVHLHSEQGQRIIRDIEGEGINDSQPRLF